MQLQSSTRTAVLADFPLTLSQVQRHLRLNNEEDARLCVADYGKAVIEDIESYTSLTLQLSEMLDVFDFFPNRYGIKDGYRQPGFHLVGRPIKSVIAIEYLQANEWQVFDKAQYRIMNHKFPYIVSLNKNGLWPLPDNEYESVRVRYTAGYASSLEWPQMLLHAVYILLGHYYENRDHQVTGTIVSTYDVLARLLSRYDFNAFC